VNGAEYELLILNKMINRIFVSIGKGQAGGGLILARRSLEITPSGGVVWNE
jgi:hypothetical protein